MPVLGPLAGLLLLAGPFVAQRRRQGSALLWVLGLCAALWLWYLGHALAFARDAAAWSATFDLLVRMLPLVFLPILAWLFAPPMGGLVSRLAPGVAMLALGLAWVEWLFEGDRSEVATGNQLMLAASTLPLALLSLTLARRETGWVRLWGYGGVLAAGLVISALAGSRGAFLGLLGGLAAGFVFDLVRHRLREVPWGHYGVLGGLMVLVLVCSVNWGPGRYQYQVFKPYLGVDLSQMMAARADTAGQATEQATGTPQTSVLDPLRALIHEPSPSVRIQLWHEGAAAIGKAPILGSGAGEIGRIMTDLTAAHSQDPKPYHFTFSHLHNAYLTHWVMGGIVPVLLLIALILCPVFLVSPARRQLAVMWSVSILLVGVSNLLVMEGFAAILVVLALICLTDTGDSGTEPQAGAVI